ncbi:hypothetical protein [Deinococcus deserti]|uniref:Uncharacterized protein n=1 Tax=Deinococcus deserti (strain DSM 17065 / CIP 109153 / LMG 22923 / VCD115) TaxID=546414 RepID=C1D011_DEIDV|nr:hypothetical protein [Deinococcus deserti]ACO45263.2 Hypothetical protein Deide_04340 [Deinococcus deserti VCD115]
MTVKPGTASRVLRTANATAFRLHPAAFLDARSTWEHRSGFLRTGMMTRIFRHSGVSA